MATITNSGIVDATFILECVANGTDANVGTTVPYTVEADSTLEIPLNWDSAYEGDLVLGCDIFVPYHFEGFEVVTTGTASTESVAWSEVEDDSANLFLPLTIGVVVAVILYVVIMRMRLNNETPKEHLTSVEVDEDDEDTGTIE